MVTNNADNQSNPISVVGGGTGNASFTAYSVITGGTTSTGALQNVSGVGTSGQLLTSGGASALPTWKDSGSIVKLATRTASAGTTSLDFTSVLSSTYKNYMVIFSNTLPQTNGANLTLQYSTDNGSTWSSVPVGGTNRNTYNTNTFTNVNGAGYVSAPSSNTVTAGNGIAYLMNITGTKVFFYFGRGGVVTGVGTAANYTCIGRVSGLFSSINAIQFIYSTGNFASGKITLYGFLE